MELGFIEIIILVILLAVVLAVVKGRRRTALLVICGVALLGVISIKFIERRPSQSATTTRTIQYSSETASSDYAVQEDSYRDGVAAGSESGHSVGAVQVDSSIGIIGILLIVLVLAGAVIAVKSLKNKPKRDEGHSFNWGIAGGVSLAVLVGVVVLFRVNTSQRMERQDRVEQMHRQAPSESARLENPDVAMVSQETPSIWQQGIEDQFDADTYPSVRAAVRALAVRAMEKLKGFGDDEEAIGTVWFYGSDQIKEDLYKEAGGYLDSKYPTSNIQIIHNSGGAAGKKGAFLDFIRTKYQLRNKKLEGTIQVNLRYKDNSFSYIQNYTHKKWVDNLDVFLNQNPHGQYVVAYSQNSCTNRQQASKEAMAQATKLVAQKMVENRQHTPGCTVNPGDIQNLIADRFTQAMDGSQGKIWREALLLDYSHGRYGRVVSQINHQDSAKAEVMRSRWASMIFSVVALAGLICGIYFVLNMATRGYYTLVLRIILGIVALGGLLVLSCMIA